MRSTDFSIRAIWRLTLPQVCMMFFFFCLGLTDVWTAGQIGDDVQAAFGLVSQCVVFLQVLVMAMGSGAIAAISQSLGAGKPRRARRYICMVLVLALLLGLIVALLAFLGEGVLFTVLRTPQSILPITLAYWNISLITLPAAYVFAASGVVFRATRTVMPPLWVAAGMCLANFFGNLAFGLGYFGMPAFGFKGIAWTTFFCTLMAALANCGLLSRAGFLSRSNIPTLPWVRRAAPYLLRVALPAGASQLVWQTGYVALFAVAASLPHDSVSALAGMTAGMRIEALLFLPGLAFNMTAAVMVGNSLGAGDTDQARRLALLLVGTGSLCMSVVALIMWPFIHDIATLICTTADAQAQTVSYLRYNLISTPFTIGSMVLGGVMTGAGATRYNLIIFGGSFWLIRLPVALVFGHYIWMDASGIFLGMLTSQVVQCSIMVFALFRAPWTSYAMNCAAKTQDTNA